MRPCWILATLFASCRLIAADAPAASVPADASLLEHLLAQEYLISRNIHGDQAPNRNLGIRTYFNDDGLEIVSRDAAALPVLHWKVRAFGREDLSAALAPGAVSTDGIRAEIRQSSLTQIFENRPDGLGVQIRIDSAPVGNGPVWIAVDTGNTLKTGVGDAGICLCNATTPMRLAPFEARAADGRQVDVSTSTAAGTILVKIDDAGASFPITLGSVFTGTWDARLQVDQLSAHFGTSVAFIGDLNLDSIGDFIVGAPDWDGGEVNEGAVFVYYGRDEWFATGLAPDLRIEINQASARYGYSVAAAGDMNRDNAVDFIVGAPGFNNGNANEGAAFVYSGADVLFGNIEMPRLQLEANRSNAEMGTSVAGAGDTDGDGYDDILVGAPTFEQGTTLGGRAWLYRGGATFDGMADVVYSSTVAGDQLGASVASAGDTNGDGRADVLIAAPGGMSVQLHRSGSIAPQDSVVIDSEDLPPGDHEGFGSTVAGAGDLNGDGFADFAIAQPGYTNGEASEGAVFVYFGGAPFNGVIDATLQSNLAGAGFGTRIAGADDINGDGYADLVVGAPLAANGQVAEGQVFVYLGRNGSFPTSPVRTLEINQVDALMGSSIAIGDIDDDGYADILAGAPQADFGFSDEGALFVYRGGAGHINSVADTTLSSGQASDYLGASISGAGDINRDGYSDVIVGAPGFDGGEPDEGRAWIYLGSPQGLIATPYRVLEANQEAASFGHSVAAAGDIDGDGYADVVVGAPWFDDDELDEGTAFVFLGGANMDTVADARYEGNATNSQFGLSVAGANDVNGDGRADIIVGATGNTGRALVYFGGDRPLDTTPVLEIAAAFPATQFGFAVAGAGDVNGDGFGDVIVGEPARSAEIGGATLQSVGRVSLFLGAVGRSMDALPDAILTGESSGERFGSSVAGAGDVDADGFDDIIIGAPHAALGASQTGKAFVNFGSEDGRLVRRVMPAMPLQSDSRFGTSVAAAGDVNADGFADLIIGVPTFDVGSVVDAGIAIVYYGGIGALNASDTLDLDPHSRANFGYAVAGAGDINGDGFADVLVGAPHLDPFAPPAGVAKVFLGGQQSGRDRNLQQRLDDAYPIPPWGSAGTNLSGFTFAANGTSPRGRESVKLVVQICPSGSGFPGPQPQCFEVTPNGWNDTGLAGIVLYADSGIPLPRHSLNHWRARFAYAPIGAPLTSLVAAPRSYGPWMTYKAQPSAGDVRIRPYAIDTIFLDDFD